MGLEKRHQPAAGRRFCCGERDLQFVGVMRIIGEYTRAVELAQIFEPSRHAAEFRQAACNRLCADTRQMCACRSGQRVGNIEAADDRQRGSAQQHAVAVDVEGSEPSVVGNVAGKKIGRRVFDGKVTYLRKHVLRGLDRVRRVGVDQRDTGCAPALFIKCANDRLSCSSEAK